MRRRLLHLGLLGIAFCFCGCRGKTARTPLFQGAKQPLAAQRERGPSPERRYAEAVFVEPTAFGEQWIEVDRAVIARTRYQYIDVGYSGKGPSTLFPDNGKRLLAPKGDFIILGGVVYGRADADSPAVLVRATYLYDRYKALPLSARHAERFTASADAGEAGPVKDWTCGEDGIALGLTTADSSIDSEVLASHVSAAPEEATDDDDVSPVIEEALEPQDNPRLVYLAADGVFVELRMHADLDETQTQIILGRIRERLAGFLATEKKELIAHDKFRQQIKGSVAMRQFMRPDNEVFWDALGRLVYGNWYKKKF